MIHRIKNQNISHNAFTLIELVIVLVIIGILLMATLYLSGEQIQKVRDKTVKESILSEWLSRYSRNLGSSSFSEIMYKDMDIKLEKGKNNIIFEYIYGEHENEKKENIFVDKFDIKYIKAGNDPKDNIDIIYHPYQIKCEIGEDGGDYDLLNLVIRVNKHKDYCFEINNKNCRLIELSESNCDTFKITEGLED